MKVIACLALAQCIAQGLAADGSSKPWEWAAIFEMPSDGPSTWVFQKVGGAYADATMQICWLSSTTNNEAGLEAREHEAEACYEQNATVVNAGTTLAPSTLYTLTFDQNSFSSSWFVDPVEGSRVAAFFLQHYPYEFEDRVHWLQSVKGEDVEFGFEEPDDFFATPELPNEKGKAYLASVIVILVCFTGVVLSNSVIIKAFGGIGRFANTSAAFACGALMYCAFALLLPEGLHLIGAQKEDGTRYTESEVSAVYATSFAVGIVACIALDLLFQHKHDHAPATAKTQEGDGQITGKEMVELAIEDGKSTAVASPEQVELNASDASFFDWSKVEGICYQIIVGDFFHNFVDGIVIGAAFMTCESSAGWTVTAGTIYHEISQEVADFLVLTTKGRMTFAQACLGNFISALGVLVGCVAVVESEPSQPVQGALMAFGASFYLYISLAELQWWKVREDLIRNAFFFFLGCLGIGLVLISHEHCAPVSGGGHAH